MQELAIYLFLIVFIAALLVALVQGVVQSRGGGLGARGTTTVTVISLAAAGLFVMYLLGNSA